SDVCSSDLGRESVSRCALEGGAQEAALRDDQPPGRPVRSIAREGGERSRCVGTKREVHDLEVGIGFWMVVVDQRSGTLLPGERSMALADTGGCSEEHVLRPGAEDEWIGREVAEIGCRDSHPERKRIRRVELDMHQDAAVV